MTRAVTHTWYRIALARTALAPTLVAAHGEHLGEAIAAAEHHLAGSRAIAAEVATQDQVPLGESVGKQPVVALPEADTSALHAAPRFPWPVGALPQLGYLEPLRDATAGFAIHPDPALLVIEAQVGRDHLVDVFLGVLERLPAGDNLEVRLLDHFDAAGRTDVWLTSRVNAKKILRFLDDHETELIENGHVELSIYARAQRATLRLTEHKTVVWLSEDRAFEPTVIGWLGELGVARVPRLVRITDAPHFHYRPLKSRDRKKLADQLYRHRLRRVDTVARDTAG